VVDEHRLLLAPVSPALAAYLTHYPLPDFPGKGWPLEALAGLVTSRALHVCHC